MQAILFTSVSGIPLPGAVGISETIFLKIFEGAFGESMVSCAVLLSRGVTFYLYVIISMLVALINAIRMRKKTGKDDGIIIGERLDNSDKNIKFLPL